MKRDLSYWASCPIAVLGAGAVGMTLGIGHMTKEQLLDYLYTGKYYEKQQE